MVGIDASDSVLRAVQDPLETVRTLPADLDQPMVLRSKDGVRGKRSRAGTSPPPRPATSSGTGMTCLRHSPAHCPTQALVAPPAETYLHNFQHRQCS